MRCRIHLVADRPPAVSLVNSGEREATYRDMSLVVAYGPWSLATSQLASARISSSLGSLGSLANFGIDQKLEHLADVRCRPMGSLSGRWV